MARLLLLTLTLVAPAFAWVSKSQSMYGAQISEIAAQMNGASSSRDPQAQLAWLWHFPENTGDSRGLGGGITYAWDPNLCEPLASRFSEDIFGFPGFLDCSTIKAAVARGFDKWAANNRFIKFLDVTEECALAGYPDNWNHPTVPASNDLTQQHNGCPLAEIWITRYASSTTGRRRKLQINPGPVQVDPSTGQALPTLQAYEDMQEGGVAVATAQPIPRYAWDFRFTNGERPFYADRTGTERYNRPFIEVYGGIFRFNADDNICWYMDSAFCSGFHILKAELGGADAARVLVYGLTFGLMALGVLFYLCFLVRICLRASGIDAEHHDDEDGDGHFSCSERLNAGVRAISHYNPIVLTLFIALLFIPPLIAIKLFNPCFECYDFEAAALHEIGHFLGLGHPDNIPSNWEFPRLEWAGPLAGENSYQADIAAAAFADPPTRPNTTSTCMRPWDRVFPGIPENTPTAMQNVPVNYTIRNCQLEARTQHNPLSCLMQDDIEGISVLYPDCGEYPINGEGICHNVNMNIGLVRIAVYILLPSIISLLFVVACSTVIHAFERREKERLAASAAKHKENAKKEGVLGKKRVAAAKAAHHHSRRQRGRTPSTAHKSQESALPAGYPQADGV